MAEEVQLLDRLEKLGLAQGNTLASSAHSELQSSANQSQAADVPSQSEADEAEDDDDRIQPRSRDGSSARSLDTSHLPTRRSSEAESMRSAEASMIQTPAAVSRAEPVPGQQSALHYYKPHDGFAEGCPAPPCFQERVSTAMGIYKKMELRDGELGEQDWRPWGGGSRCCAGSLYGAAACS